MRMTRNIHLWADFSCSQAHFSSSTSFSGLAYLSYPTLFTSIACFSICRTDAKCIHERGRNQMTQFVIQVMFSVFRGPKYDDIKPNHTKNIKKLLSGYFLAYPSKMHYSAPQCSAMYCSVNAWIIHSRWVKYDPELPRMTDYSPGWHKRGQGGTRGSRGAPGGARLLPTPKIVIKQ